MRVKELKKKDKIYLNKTNHLFFIKIDWTHAIWENKNWEIEIWLNPEDKIIKHKDWYTLVEWKSLNLS